MKTLTSNYGKNGFVVNPNAGFGRNKRPPGALEVRCAGACAGARLPPAQRCPGPCLSLDEDVAVRVQVAAPEEGAEAVESDDGARPAEALGRRPAARAPRWAVVRGICPGASALLCLSRTQQRVVCRAPRHSMHERRGAAAVQTRAWWRASSAAAAPTLTLSDTQACMYAERRGAAGADLRAVEGKQRRSGKAPLTKLTTHQRQVMQRLIAAHGEDVEVRRLPRRAASRVA